MKQLKDFDDYRQAAEKLEAITAQRDSKRGEAEKLRAALAAEKNHHRDALTAEAEALLTGETLPPPPEAKQLAELNHQLRVLDKAVQMAQSRVDELRTSHSAEICASVEKQYTGELKKAIDAAVTFSKHFSEARQILEGLQEGDVFTHSLPVLAGLRGGFGDWRNSDAKVYHLLREAEKEGVISPSDYKGRSVPPTPYDQLPKAGVQSVAAGPDGLREVTVHQGGRVDTTKWLHKAEPKDAVGWGMA